VEPIDIAHRQNIAEVGVLLGVTGTHAAKANTANLWPIIFRHVG
jgi:hypothetical protein